MFGLVPKPIWSKCIAPNEHNAIPQRANVWLLQWPDGRCGLLDSGCGNPAWFPEKARRLHSLPDEWPLLEALQQHGVSREDIDFVALSHLHWDHAGGLGRVFDGETDWTFPRAEYIVHALEWEDACSGNPLLYKSYPADTLAPLQAVADTRVRLIHADVAELAPGLIMRRSGGHTRGHCVFHLYGDPLEINHPGACALSPCVHAVYAADVCPTAHHLRLVFQAAYDTYPLDTRAWKQRWLPQIADQGILLLFDHDPDRFAARISANPPLEFTYTEGF